MKQIGRYRIVSELGRGAMGVVYRAHDPQIDREVALKTIRLAAHADPSEIVGMRDRLVREARLAGRLSHPGIVTIFDAGEEDGLAYVAMELVEGRSLADILAGPVVPDRKLEFLVALLDKAGSALDYASANGVVHRDVKPANIMVSGRSVKLLDFGVARVASGQATRAGTVFGTPNYMSPEQVQGGQVDGRADQFSLAVIAYEVLCGVKPFEASTVPATLFKIVHDDPGLLRTYVPDMPAPLERVVLRALQKSPQDRFSSCQEFAREFADAAQGLPGLAPPISSDRDQGQAGFDWSSDRNADPDAEPAESTGGEAGLPSPVGRGLPVREDAMSRQPPELPTEGGLTGPETGPSEPILPVGKPPVEDGDLVAEPRSRWPNLIFALLVLAIGALALLLVRYPGLLEDPRSLLDAILGRAPSATAIAPALPETRMAGEAESQPEEFSGPASGSTSASADAPEALNGQAELGSAGQGAAASSSGGLPRQDGLVSPSAAVPAASPRGASPTSGQGGIVYFRSSVDGVVVTLDGNQDWQCMTPCQLAGVPLGKRRLVARRDGYSELHRTVEVSEAALTVNLPMVRTGAVLLVSSEPPEARIILDGRDTGRTTNARLAVSPGKHAVRIVLGQLSSERSIEVAKNETRYLQFRLGTQ
ncbi:MAG: protein kinase [Bryobacterales bacterium]|nr:protein kinase [Bryobacterales bacterium]